MIRRRAFRHSESTYSHWLPLVLADRVSVFEGIVRDLAHARIPNVFAERGWKAEWRYNRRNLITRVATKALVLSAVVAALGAVRDDD